LLAKTRIEGAGELGILVADQEAEGAGLVAGSHDQVAGLLGSPRAVWVRGYAGDVHMPGLHLHDEHHVQALEEDRAGMKEVTGEEAACLSARERRPGGAGVARGWPVPPGAQDPPRCRLTDAVAGPA
jgi:hypothetical protein